MPEETTPKDLIRSMKTYARHIMGNAEDIERLVARKPENTLVEYINELKHVLQMAKEQQAWMRDDYYAQGHLVEP